MSQVVTNPLPFRLRIMMISFLMLPLIVGCAPEPDSSIQSPLPRQSQPPAGQNQNPLTYETLEEPSPGEYAVHLTLKSDSQSRFHLYRVVNLEEKRSLVLISSLQARGELTLDHQRSGETIELELTEAEGVKEEKTVQVLKISLPRDVIISGKVDAKDFDFSNVARLYFMKDSVITSHGEDLKIQAKELIAEDGSRIETFPKGAVGFNDKPARAGGEIEITATDASGSLEVNLRGENGGRWTTEPQSLANNESYRGSKGAKGSPGATISIPRFNVICAKPPGDGGPGSDGKSGLAGFGGINGGDSGHLDVNIRHGGGFKISHHREPGIGGQGSIGGVGGPGGLGGDPGERLLFCPEAKRGPNGNIGHRGPNGGDGTSGNPGHVCLKLSESEGTICM